jgi:hypothetical protein
MGRCIAGPEPPTGSVRPAARSCPSGKRVMGRCIQ